MCKARRNWLTSIHPLRHSFDISNKIQKQINLYTKWRDLAQKELEQVKEGTEKHKEISEKIERYNKEIERYNNSKL